VQDRLKRIRRLPKISSAKRLRRPPRAKRFPSFELPVHRRHLLYFFIRPWARWAIKTLFKVESVQGSEYLPKKGAALMYANHQNGLIDPVASCVLLKRQLHFFTRADVFRSRLWRVFLFRVNMLPVYRRQDRVRDLAERNTKTFKSALGRLHHGAVLGIFPEGGHYHERRLRDFRNGLARLLSLALESGLGTKQAPLTVLPVTINFAGLYNYRSRLALEVQPGFKLYDLVGCETDGLSPSQRVAVTQILHSTLQATTPQLLSGELNSGHLAVTLFLEGTGLRDEALREAIHRSGKSLDCAHKSCNDGRMVSQFQKLAESAGPPLESRLYEALGRLHAGRPTLLKSTDVLRAPFWLIHRWISRPVIAGIVRLSKRNARELAFVSTVGIPLIMTALPLWWALASLTLGWMIPQELSGHALLNAAGIFLAIRCAQSVAMPMEDRILAKQAERQARQLLSQSKFGALWATWAGEAGILDLPR
jgi:1-acyl-sn-glycerol-3-phosphate acyltransferase